jgi:hypothetical protein
MRREIIFKHLPKETIGAEIGVWKGEFAKDLFDKLNPKLLYLIDPWKFQPTFPDRWYGGTQATSQEDMNIIYNNVQTMFKDFENVKIIKGNINDIPDNIELDWVYIDGDHSYEAVLHDLKYSFNIVKNKGFITGDDYDIGNDIYKAVHSFLLENSNVSLLETQNRQFIIQIIK